MPTTEWLEQGRARCLRALAQASAEADRLALMRALTRLNGGRLDLIEHQLVLSPNEQHELDRFGLAVTGDGSALRLSESSVDDIAPGLAAALNLDPAPRTVFEAATPDAVLLRCSQHRSYKSQTQKSAVAAVVTMPPGGALLVSMPTGSGKSLLFQIAPRWWRRREPGACIAVITPTVALADDHERTLRKIPGLENSRALTGALSVEERRAILDGVRRGEVPILLLSPEAAFGSAREDLIEAAKPPEQKYGLPGRLVGFFVDEAHIIESWGRSFRPDFQRLPGLVSTLRSHNPELRTVLLSATLGRSARQILRESYGGGAWLEIHAGVPRYDFDLVARGFTSRADRDAAMMRAIDLAPRPTVVYATRVEDAGGLYERLKEERGYSRMALFTGEVSDARERRQIVADWADDRIDLVVATSAFGLGVDKQDVRSVLHACLPEGAARYYQEVGRASRDGHQGLGLCLFTLEQGGEAENDEADAVSMATGSWLTRELAEERWDALRAAAKESWVADERRLTLPLDAARKGLGRWTGALNRRWNMSLLNLLQRAGALRIEAVVDEEGTPPAWQVVLLDDRLLSRGHDAAECWTEIFGRRNAEQREAAYDVSAFRNLMKGRQPSCLLTGVFELVEPDVWRAPDCGRCVDCRRRGVRPPRTLEPNGLDQVWADVARTDFLPPGRTLVSPEDPRFDRGFERLIQRLADLGLEQFVVPDGRGHEAAAVLARNAVDYGLVIETRDLVAPRRRLCDVPTAVLLPKHDARVAESFDRTTAFLNENPKQVLVLVADPDLRVKDRALSQIASQTAAYAEAALEALAGLRPSQNLSEFVA